MVGGGDEADDLDTLLPVLGYGAAQLRDLSETYELGPVRQDRDIDDLDGPGGAPPVAELGGAGAARDLRPGQLLQLFEQRGLVRFDGEDAVSSRVEDGLRGIVRGVHRIGGDHASVQVRGLDPGQDVPHGGNLVGLRIDLTLPQDDSCGVVERGDQMWRRRRGSAGATDGLAIDGDHSSATDLADRTPRVDRQCRIERSSVEAGEVLRPGFLGGLSSSF